MSRSTHRLVATIVALALLMPALLVTAQTSNDAFNRTWERTDRPVSEGQVNRTWMWGPGPNTPIQSEPYIEAPNGERQVVYFDKSRMEITDPSADQSSIWYVTNGLLSTELITGRLQLGNDTFEQREPAQINVAGDANDPTGPTYATFNTLLDAAPAALHAAITQRVSRAGQITQDSALGGLGVTAVHIDEVTHHAIAEPFWLFMTATGIVYEGGSFTIDSLFENPFFATGRPITEAYWANVLVAGTPHDVLMQCFERRCLTYTPGNPEGWQVEAGNVGQHYHAWRYADAPALAQITVHYIDVGQADATLIHGPEFSILIDAAGWQQNNVVPYLQSVGVTELDLLVGTHPDADHIGQFPQVLAAFDVAEVWLSGDEHTTRTFENAIDAILDSGAVYHEPRAGEVFTYGALRIEIVNPAQITGNFNTGSIGLRAVYGDVRFLFTGDTEADTEQQMINRGHDLNAQILQVGHHGSDTSTAPAFLDAVQPEVAIYSASATNAFGHPSPELIDRLLARGIEVYGTDVSGNIRVITNGQTYAVHVDRGEAITDPGQPAPPDPTPTTPPDPSPPPPPPPPPSGCVDLNTASFEDLQEVIHIGPDRAQQIINMRPFSSVDQLVNVSGIGEVRLADIKAQGVACVGASGAVPPPNSGPAGNSCTATTQAMISQVTDGLGNTNPNSWAQGTGGDWVGGLDAAPTIPVGTTLNINVTASGECTPLEYRFNKQPAGGSFIVLRDWSTSSSFIYTIQQEDYGMWFLTIPEIRDTDERTRFNGVDDYNYLSYVVE